VKVGRFIVAVLLLALAGGTARAKNPEQPETATPLGTEETFFDHGKTGPIWIGAEINSIAQYSPSFRAAYSGTNSFGPNQQAAISGLMTVFSALRMLKLTEVIIDGEIALGGGLSQALGIAGFTNLDVVRNPTLSKAPYAARVQIHQIIPLTREWERNDDRGPISSFAEVPRHRLEIRVGKMSTADLFDVNPAASDSHLQFMNWAVDNNGAYDYAADTRGYTYGLVLEYQGPRIEVRFGEMLMPKVANGIDLDWDLAHAHADNLEVELKYSRRPGWRGTLRILGYGNHANMGNYQTAINAFRAGKDPYPDITKYPVLGNYKYGFGFNLYQELGGVARVFARGGWNDGHAESFAYTEIDDTFLVGFDLSGGLWHRPHDKIGLAFVTNGISNLHREYLQLGGHGFILGDGDPNQPRASNLSYARENILEWYYNVHIWRGAFAATDIQLVDDPGYNHARGPAWVFSVRGHLEF
jgi:hypothetical protein